ncbi:MAG: chemotaxis protein CheW [Phycisphaerales bacterium]|nr:MAG: chemotaxis protein CheW [Phycisphaerales bacterium]
MSTSLKTNGTAGTTKGAVGVELQLVTFDVAGEEYAVNILSVQEINRMMELTRVPQSPPEVEGVINLRGQIIPVVDLRKTFNLPQAAHSESSRIVVVEVHSKMVGLIVDRVHEVRRIDQSIVEPPPAMVCSLRSEFIDGVGKLEDRLIILLNLSKLFPESSMTKMSNAA